jgi:2,3-bisphosphoglycerate-independent phosphoglycerate mutase
VRINKVIEEQKLIDSQALIDLAEYCIKNHKPCHLIGLVSDGGVHSHIEHVY